MKVSEAIEKLTKKRDDALHFKKLYNPGELGWTGNESKAIAYSTAINVLQQIDEPQAEKVEVTEEQAELLRAFKGESIYELLTNCLVEDEELMAKARLFGYTVKPKRWVVKNEEGRYFVAFSKYAKTPFEGVFSASVTNLVTFDDKSKANAVATLVEGSVEEV